MSSANSPMSASRLRALYASTKSRTAWAGLTLTGATYTLRNARRPPREAPADDPLRARGGRGAGVRALARVRHLPRRSRGHARGELLDRDPAAERDGRAPHGARAGRLDPGHADPDEAHAGPAHEVDLRHRTRRHRDPGESRAAPGRGG